MEKYDYTEAGNTDLEAHGLDTLTPEELRAAMEAVAAVRKKNGEESARRFHQWFDAAVLPILKDFAEKTFSALEIDRKHTEISAAIRNARGLDLSDQCRGMKMALCMAAHISVDKIDGGLILTIIYSCEKFME